MLFCCLKINTWRIHIYRKDVIDMCKKIDEKNPDVQEKEVRRMEVLEYLKWKMGEKNEVGR